MRIFVGRHAYAGPSPADPKKERERPLTSEGVAMAKAIAAAVLADNDLPTVIFCSPFARATQTADIYGKAWGVQVNQIGDLAPNRPLEETILGLMAHDELKRFAIIGHVDNTTPAFENLGGDDWDPLVMAEIRKLKIDRKTGDFTVRWALRPSDLGLKDYDE